MQLEPAQGLRSFDAADFAEATGASAAAMHDLDHFRELLEEANAQLNLVGPSAPTSFWLRHAYDSAQLLSLAPQARIWADLGAGAGFPGLIIAVFLKGKPGARVHLIDSQAKRTRFLTSVVSHLHLPAVVHTGRAEDTRPPEQLEVVTARACAPFTRLFSYAEPYLATGATGLFLKGRTVEQELRDARRSWRFEAHLHQSRSDPSGRIVQVRGLARA